MTAWIQFLNQVQDRQVWDDEFLVVAAGGRRGLQVKSRAAWTRLSLSPLEFAPQEWWTGLVCQIAREEVHVATNLAIDPDLLDEAHRLGGHNTKKATVTEALEEYIRKRKQRRLFDLFGTIEYGADYDYKDERRRDS